MNSKNIFILISSIMFSLVTQTAYAQSEGNTECPEKPLLYNMGLTLSSVGEINKSTGSYELIFWITLTSDEINFLKCPPPEIWDFTNGYVISTMGTYTEESFYKTQIHGIFFEDNDYRDYPFENMKLTVHIEPFYPLNAKDIVFKVNEEYSGVNFGQVIVPGWEIKEPTFETRIDTYPWADFPHFVATIPIDTNPLSVFVKKLLPPLILGSFAFATFFMSSTILQNRIALIGTGMIAAIFYHAVFLLGELPPLGYLTMADKIMIAIYSIYGNAVFGVLLHQRHLDVKVGFEHKEYDIEYQLNTDKKMMVFSTIIFIVVFLAVYTI